MKFKEKGTWESVEKGDIQHNPMINELMVSVTKEKNLTYREGEIFFETEMLIDIPCGFVRGTWWYPIVSKHTNLWQRLKRWIKIR